MQYDSARKAYYFGKNKFDLDEIINDNKLPLTFYYITNHQYAILEFERDKFFFTVRHIILKISIGNILFINDPERDDGKAVINLQQLIKKMFG
jgi:hypothetical protein